MSESGPGDSAWVELVRFLRGQPTAVAALLSQHVDDGRGHCRACSAGQTGAHIWPCTLYAAALAARTEVPRPPPITARSAASRPGIAGERERAPRSR